MPKWQPGQSGNPGGRLPADPEVKRLCRERSPDVIRRLIEIALHGAPKDAIHAASHILDRAFGKPEQSIGLSLSAEIERALQSLEQRVTPEVYETVLRALADDEEAVN